MKDGNNEICYPFVDRQSIVDLDDIGMYSLFDYYKVPMDGVSDAKASIQNVFDNCDGVLNFRPGTYILSGSLQLDTSKVDRLNGNGAILKVTGDFPAIIMNGSGSSSFSADPTTLTDKQKTREGSTVITGLKITSTSSLSTGTGIRITQCWEPIIRDCYMWLLRVGIEVSNRNRNIIISGNNIYQCGEYGLLFAEGTNVHQGNIFGNHISYCQTCLSFYRPQQIANMQIVGNDIEIATWPTSNHTTKRCIVINYSNTSNGLFSELEITGNTIQGHDLSSGLIDISGVSSGMIENVSIGDNQISNVVGYALKLTNVHNITLSGNTYRHISAKVLELAGTINGLVMTGEVAENGTGFVNSDSSAVLRAVTFNALTGRGMSEGITLSCNTINGLSITGCNIATSSLTISATTKDYISVVGNMLRGTYNIADATHKQVNNNI